MAKMSVDYTDKSPPPYWTGVSLHISLKYRNSSCANIYFNNIPLQEPSWQALISTSIQKIQMNMVHYYIDKSVLLENTPLVKFIGNYRRPERHIFHFSRLFVQTVSEK